MEEKYMVNDILESVKAELTTYQGVISEAENIRTKANNTTDKKSR